MHIILNNLICSSLRGVNEDVTSNSPDPNIFWRTVNINDPETIPYRGFLSKKDLRWASEGTIFHAIDNNRIETEKEEWKDRISSLLLKTAEENKSASFLSQIITPELKLTWVEGAKEGFRQKRLPLARSIFLLASAVFSRNLNLSTMTDSYLTNRVVTVIVVPVLEEIFFRGVVYNFIRGVQGLQEGITTLDGSVLENRPLLQYLTSASCAAILSGTIFACAHLGDLSENNINQVFNILFNPVEGLLYEKTGTLAAPIVEHMTNNLAYVIAEIAIRVTL